MAAMIQKIVKLKDLGTDDSVGDNLKFWLGKSPEERVSVVEYLRRQYHGSTARLQRVARVVERQSR
jgi:hypothetical protein